MIFATFASENGPRLGLVADGTVLDLREAVERGGDQGLPGAFPPDMLSLVRGEPWTLDLVRQILSLGGETRPVSAAHSLAHASLLAPIPRPAKNVFCVGRNYLEHAAEGDRARGQATAIPEHPQFFTKPATAVIGPEAPIVWDPTVTRELDYEIELAVVIGKTGKNIPRDRAYQHVFGYTVLNDVTARDLQRRHGQWFKGKALDGSCPMGPYLVHKSRVPDPHTLTVKLWVNGELRQQASTRDMIFDIPCLIETLSRGMTLEAGDIIATGTPGGVGWARTPPVFLGHGDVVECEVSGIGTLRNRVQRIA